MRPPPPHSRGLSGRRITGRTPPADGRGLRERGPSGRTIRSRIADLTISEGLAGKHSLVPPRWGLETRIVCVGGTQVLRPGLLSAAPSGRRMAEDGTICDEGPARAGARTSISTWRRFRMSRRRRLIGWSNSQFLKRNKPGEIRRACLLIGISLHQSFVKRGAERRKLGFGFHGLDRLTGVRDGARECAGRGPAAAGSGGQSGQCHHSQQQKSDPRAVHTMISRGLEDGSQPDVPFRGECANTSFLPRKTHLGKLG